MRIESRSIARGWIVAALAAGSLAACDAADGDEAVVGVDQAERAVSACNPVEDPYGLAVVSNEIGVRLRTAPTTDDASLITTLLPETVVRFVPHDAADLAHATPGYRWQRVVTVPPPGEGTGLRGWVATSAVDDDAFDDDPWFDLNVVLVTTSEGLNLRSSPNLRGASIVNLARGQARPAGPGLPPGDLEHHTNRV
jgi:hypothetical protein